MIKFFALVGRKPSWSRDAWLAHYRDRHGPLVARTTGFVEASIGYRQNEVFATFPAEAGRAFDGMTELWFEDSAAMARAFSAPDYLQDVRPDELYFANPEAIVAATGEPDSVRAGSNPGHAVWHLVVFRAAIESRFPQDVKMGTARGATRTVLTETGNAPEQPFAVVEEFWFEDEASARAFETRTGPGDLVVLARARNVYGCCVDGPG